MACDDVNSDLLGICLSSLSGDVMVVGEINLGISKFDHSLLLYVDTVVQYSIEKLVPVPPKRVLTYTDTIQRFSS